MALREVTPIKKIALAVKTARGMLSFKLLPDSPTEIAGSAITHTSTQIAQKGNAIPHLTEVHGSLSLVSHRREVSGLYELVFTWLQRYSGTLAWLYIR